ncbi:acyl-CoA thioesterase [Halobacillus litoralis]|uniref:Acyl-CoA thioesterase n=1 Tax=Halobacillus litoralis TaxID=45668 RepID=A0A845DT63_9BACI|nr:MULTISPECIES: acyl-CoA thioesterase [Halobacillus]MCA1020815.1 acyl-CoA thioesterase [Halobacillus litoralis]MYL20348.1 acyl-CoA thioesterase [Halobacillus litoralis]MYL29443.1 acyl-CoA thioesterase [Halobacillus halophilus]MYL36660.1 acyl-CoA thioesterase [Halobacillus litoralis]
MDAKPCIDSLTVKNSHVLPPDTNTHGTLFGGKLMAHIDDVAAIAAVRHCRKPVVTASTDSVDFLQPVFEGDTVCLEAFVTWAHNTSMEVFVKATTENLLTGERKVCTTAFLSMVAVDENNDPTPVPSVYPETEEEQWLHDHAQKRHEHRKNRRKESKELAEKFGTSLPWRRNS